MADCTYKVVMKDLDLSDFRIPRVGCCLTKSMSVLEDNIRSNPGLWLGSIKEETRPRPLNHE